MKSKFVFSSAAIIAASHVGFAAAYIFSGGSDLSVPENYLLSDGASSFVSINSYYHDGNSGFVLPSGNLTKSETLPASYNWLGIGDYSGAEVESSPTDLRLSSSNLIDMGGDGTADRGSKQFTHTVRVKMRYCPSVRRIPLMNP